MAAGLVITADGGGGEEALERLKAVEPQLYLSPSPEISRLARSAASHLFSSLASLCPKPPPLGTLLAGEEFDAEQIWGQVDSLSASLVSMLRREVKRLEQEPPELVPPGTPARGATDVAAVEDADRDEDDGEEEDEEDDGEEEDEEDDADEEEEEEETASDGEGNGVEDRFLKIKELQDYLEKAEAEEYGLPERNEGIKKDEVEEDEEEEEEEDDDGEEEDELQYGGLNGDGDEETEFGESAKYEDFYGGKKITGGSKGSKKEKGSSKKVRFADELEGSDMDDDNDNVDSVAQSGVLSTHEKELQKMHSKIEQMEKVNMEPKSWIMQGEVTAVGRPKNSALEADLDFQHNVRPAPAITEEVTASLEDLIRKRIMEEDFDDVQKASALPSKAPKELKELDENKSKKGLAEIYEEEFAQKAGLVSAPLSSSDEQKKEATVLFKNLCLKLDALSHFHFAPKPIIEDMSIQANVPALAMEEIAPLAVSDAAMLAPEEVYKGKGDIKEEAELTQAERKRRRANKKRRYKAEESKRGKKEPHNSVASGHLIANEDKRAAKKARSNGASDNPNGKENSSHSNLPGWKKA